MAFESVFVDIEPEMKDSITTETKGFAYVWGKNPDTVIADGGIMFKDNEENYGADYIDVYYNGKRITEYRISGVIDDWFYTTITENGRIRIVAEQNAEMTVKVKTANGTGTFIFKTGVSE